MSTNISKQKRSNLINKIKLIKNYIAKAEQDKNTGNLLTYLSELEKEINGKKYGLVFEEHEEEIDQKLKTHTPVLSEEKNLFINNGGQMNFLIEGDNLPALKLLEKTHRGKVDVIYIDPPYNTGSNDFIYDDNYVDKSDLFKHSKWLSFMLKRLECAKSLLKDSGFLFISINSLELANLKVLCDEIFGEDNFINLISIKTKIAGVSGSSEGKSLQNNNEFVLFYAKLKEKISLVKIPEYIELSNYIESMNNEGKSWKYTSVLENVDKGKYIKSIVDGDGKEIKIFEHKDYSIKSIAAISKERYKGDIKAAYYGEINKIFRTTNAQSSIRTRIINGTKEITNSKLISIEYVPKKGRNKGKVTKLFYTDPIRNLVTFLSDVVINKNGMLYKIEKKGTLWTDIQYNNVAREGDVTFENGKKPIRLMYQLSLMCSNKDATIIDFFAGSGSTGHAILQMNRDDGGNRKFILVTNNQNDICKEKAYPRLCNVIKEAGDKVSLKYFKVDFVSIDEKLYYEYADQLLKHIRELVELENGINFEENSKIKIILTDAELAAFSEKEIELKKCQKLYLGHDVLVSGVQEKLFKDHEIEINIIPDYYYKELES